MSRHYHLMTETFALRYRRRAGVDEAVFTPTTAMRPAPLHFLTEVQAVAHWNQVRLMLGPDAPAIDTTLAMPAPPHARRYDTLAPARFHFDAGAMPGLRVLMDAELLDMPQPLADSRLRQQIDARCRALARRAPTGDKGWGEFVTMMLARIAGHAAHAGRPGAADQRLRPHHRPPPEEGAAVPRAVAADTLRTGL